MPHVTHSDNLSPPVSEELCPTTTASVGIPENNISGKGDNPDVCSAENRSETASADSCSKLDNISGNTSATHFPIDILTSPDLESQEDSGQLLEVVPDEEGKELTIQNQYGIGIDVHLKFFVTSVLVRRNDKVLLYTKEFKTDSESISKAKIWSTSIIERNSDPKVTVGDNINYTIESTSTFHMPILHIWEGNPAVVNPMLAKAGRRKSDVIDSIALATIDLYGTWARTYTIPIDVHELRVLVHERNHYERLATQCS